MGEVKKKLNKNSGFQNPEEMTVNKKSGLKNLEDATITNFTFVDNNKTSLSSTSKKFDNTKKRIHSTKQKHSDSNRKTKNSTKALAVQEKTKDELAKIDVKSNFLEALKENKKEGNLNSFETVNMFLDKGYIGEDEVVEAFSKEYGFNVIDNLLEYSIAEDVLELIPIQICLKHLLIPLSKIDNTLVVVFYDPSNTHVIDNISLLTGFKIQPAIARKTEIKKFLGRVYNNQEEVNKLFYEMDAELIGFEEQDAIDLDEEKHGSPVINFVNLIFSDAIRLKCSDIHVEVYEKSFRIRYRIDGMLKEIHSLAKDMATAVVSRIKVMCDMDISEKRRSQDARLKVKVSGEELNMRVSSIPTINGEKIVLRILDDSSLKVDLSDLGMDQFQSEMFLKAISQPQGLVLLTGPTGSGKTTTIYSGLMHLNTPDKNISTAEDPVEFRVHGINQVQINPKIDLDFSSILRAFLRQDPDVILVGEIRDIETAEISLKASSTGHLVLSTLHTNDTASTVTRLLGMGVPTYSIADNVSLIVSQRLLRRLCDSCKLPVSEEMIHKMLAKDSKLIGVKEEEIPLYIKAKIFKRSEKGCAKCNNLAYKGRVAVYEMLPIIPEIKAGIFEKLSPQDLKKLAIDSGMITLRHSALNKMREGHTSLEEVIRTTVFDY